MNKINENFNEIILHCSATYKKSNFKANDIRQWHIAKGWADIGYHFVIKLDGIVEKGRDLTKKGSHCLNAGKNNTAIGICYIGGMDNNEVTGQEFATDTRTEEQKVAIDNLLRQLKVKYPQLEYLSGHNQWASKECPCFNVNEEYKHLSNLYKFWN